MAATARKYEQGGFLYELLCVLQRGQRVVLQEFVGKRVVGGLGLQGRLLSRGVLIMPGFAAAAVYVGR
jgi:hypothetical protein